MKVDRVCPRCDGTGRVSLTPELQLIYDALAAHPGSTLEELLPHLPITASALRDRMRRLRATGLIERVPAERRQHAYQVKNGG